MGIAPNNLQHKQIFLWEYISEDIYYSSKLYFSFMMIYMRKENEKIP